uniref:Putative secreted protein n=1 Tax=Panstrongylus lignarius TaxID=156445 RepID=A0A224XQT6_9HEMI
MPGLPNGRKTFFGVYITLALYLTLRNAVADCVCPAVLITSHLYSPKSVGCASEMVKEPPGLTQALCPTGPNGRPSLYHTTRAVSSFDIHSNVTASPSETV